MGYSIVFCKIASNSIILYSNDTRIKIAVSVHSTIEMKIFDNIHFAEKHFGLCNDLCMFGVQANRLQLLCGMW